MFNIMSNLLTETFKTFIASLSAQNSRKMLKKLLELLVLLEIFEFLQLGLINDVSLKVFETLSYELLLHLSLTFMLR